MTTIDDLAQLAALVGARITRQELEREAPLLRALLADQDRLLALPIDDRAPALAPSLSSRESRGVSG